MTDDEVYWVSQRLLPDTMKDCPCCRGQRTASWCLSSPSGKVYLKPCEGCDGTGGLMTYLARREAGSGYERYTDEMGVW